MTRTDKTRSLMIAAEISRGLNASRAPQIIEAQLVYLDGTEKRERVTLFSAVLGILEARELAFRKDDLDFYPPVAGGVGVPVTRWSFGTFETGTHGTGSFCGLAGCVARLTSEVAV